MTYIIFAIALIVVSVLCAMGGYIFAKGKSVEEIAALKASKQEYERLVSELKEDALNDKEEMRTNHKEQMELQKKNFEQQMVLFQDKLNLQTQEMLKKREEELRKSNETQMSQIVTPLKEQIDQLNKQLIGTKQDAAVKEAKFEEMLAGFVKQALSMGDATEKLAQAMMSNNKIHGDWGEHVLEQILEASGLKKDMQYKVQQSSVDEDGNTLRPDVYILCPGKRQIVVDSKVSLKAFANYVSARTPEEAQQYEEENYRAMKNQVDNLAKKGYGTLEANNYKTVLMFVPNEGAYILAMRHDPMLSQYAYDKGIVILTSTNLLLTLQLIEGMWQKENEGERIEEILTAAGSLFEKFVAFSDKFAAIEKALGTASSSYLEARNYLTDGKGNVVRQIKRLTELGAKYNRSKRINEKLDNCDVLESAEPDKEIELQ